MIFLGLQIRQIIPKDLRQIMSKTTGDGDGEQSEVADFDEAWLVDTRWLSSRQQSAVHTVIERHQSSRPILAVAFPAMRAMTARGNSLGNKDVIRTLIRPG
jgi:hypothetical protein